MNTLVVGGRGLLGTALVAEFKRLYSPSRHKIACTLRGPRVEDGAFELDLKDDYPTLPYPYPYTRDEDWQVMFLVAAVTGIMACEVNAAATWRVNADAPVELARQARRRNIFTVFISSDAVEKAPRLNYSMQKAYVESFVLASGGAVVRPSRIPKEGFGGLITLLHKVASRNQAGVHRWNP